MTTAKDGTLYAIDGAQLRALRRVMTRLHSEDRLDGNEMRDLGHTIEAIVRVVEQMEIPDEGKKDGTS